MQAGMGSMSDDVTKISNSNDMNELDDRVLQDLYMWVDQIPLSRPKKNIARDFSDGVLVAEICKHFFPQHVELHNYPSANNTKQKVENWYLLNRRVFKKMKFEIADEVIRQVSAGRPWVIEHILLLLRSRIDRVLYQRGTTLSRTASDDNVNVMGTGAGDSSFRGMGGNQFGTKDYNVVHVGSINKNQGMNQQSLRPQPQSFSQKGGSLPPRPSQLPKPAQNGRAGHIDQNAYVDTALANKVPRAAMEEKEQELLAKDETIQILQAKIRRLEHLVHLKDIRIDELQQKVQQFQTGAPVMPTNQSNNAHMAGGPLTGTLSNSNRGGYVPSQRMAAPNGANANIYRSNGGGNQNMMMVQQNMAVRSDDRVWTSLLNPSTLEEPK